ncbi:hypothetical protein HOY80DRAFT_1072166 [Tuber brumale]|nr:hypothetical protein HOY80DRAFT_1072166 [Tuber brumale]
MTGPKRYTLLRQWENLDNDVEGDGKINKEEDSIVNDSFQSEGGVVDESDQEDHNWLHSNQLGKSPSRQTLWRQRKKRQEQYERESALGFEDSVVNSDDEEALFSSLIEEGYRNWPRLTKVRYHEVKRYILSDEAERKWIQSRQVSLQKKHKYGSILSCLDEEETRLVIQEFIAGAGDTLTSHLLAAVITTYWTTGQLPDHFEPNNDQVEVSLSSRTAVPLNNNPNVQAFGNQVQKVLKSRTVAAWLHKLGYKYKEVKKGVYRDGHKQEDVVAYRQNEFLPALDHLKPFMVKWELDIDSKPVLIFPKGLPEGQKPIVLVTHDESTFDSNDGRGYAWMKDVEPLLRKMSCGKGIIVSEFLSAGGWLQAPSWLSIEDLPSFGLSSDLNLRYSPYLATMKVEYSSDLWWKGEDLVNQVLQVAIPIFEWVFPGCQALFLFDNATSHSAFADDALQKSEDYDEENYNFNA